MKSQIEQVLQLDAKGVMHLVPKEYPEWYGIPDIGFVWNGAWSDPELEYNGKLYNAPTIEYTMYDWYMEDKPNMSFGLYMRSHAEEVYELMGR